jgi:hypothetical protein
MAKTRLGVVVVLVVAAVGEAAAQGIERPPRATSGIFAQRRNLTPNAPVQELSMLVDLFGGYDDNIAEGSSSGGSTVPQRSTYVGRAEVEMRFRKARRSRSLEALGRGFVNHTSINNNQFLGGEATVQGATGLGRRSGLSTSLTASNEPTSLFDAFGQLAGQTESQSVSDSAPTLGITNQRWLMGRATAGVYRNLSSRQRLELQYIANQRRPLSGQGLESQSQAGVVRYDWRFSRDFTWQTTYHYDENRQSDQVGDTRPLRSHTGDVGLRYGRTLSANRRIAAGAGGGVSYVRAFNTQTDQRREFVVPTAYGLARLDLGRTWGIQADGRRDVTILQGVSPEPFATNAATVRLDGLLGERFQFGTSGAFTRGGAIVSDTGTFNATGATAQLQFILARYASVFTTYRHFRYRLIDVAAAPPGFPSRFNRNSLQLGVTLWLPLSGNF